MSDLVVTQGILAVISGPSGVGKSSIITRLLEDERFALSVSATTREPRRNEVDGRDYWFLSETEFRQRIDADQFLEHAVVHKNARYGTLRSEVDRLVEAGKVVILDIDVQGAAAISGLDRMTTVFIAPPSLRALEERLRARGSETKESLERRLETAKTELAAAERYEHLIVNDDLEQTIAAIKNILLAAAGRANS